MQMMPRPSGGCRNSSGFTLVELMVTVVIASTLIAIAIPSYNTQIRKSRRTDAKTALLDLAGREERYYNTHNGVYTSIASYLGYAPSTDTTTPLTNQPVGSGYYTVSVSNLAGGSATTAATFTLQATPVAGTDQANDAACTSFTVDSAGRQTATGSANASIDCWK